MGDELRREETEAGPYRTPAEIAAEMPRAPRAPFPWTRIGGIVAIAQGPLVIGVLYDVGSRGTQWMGTMLAAGVLAGVLTFAAFVSFPAWWDK